MPSNFTDFLTQLMTGFVFLGIISAGATGLLWKALEENFNWVIAPNWKRTVSLIMPFLLSVVAFLILSWMKDVPFTADEAYQAIITAFYAVGGKQATYTVYKAMRGPDATEVQAMTMYKAQADARKAAKSAS